MGVDMCNYKYKWHRLKTIELCKFEDSHCLQTRTIHYIPQASHGELHIDAYLHYINARYTVFTGYYALHAEPVINVD